MKKYPDNNIEMVESQIKGRNVSDPKVIQAMKEVDRINFVDEEYEKMAYADRPLPIGNDQTISQPYIVGLMTKKLDLNENSKVLEVGTGCGYQTAILCKIAEFVYSIEVIENLKNLAEENLSKFDFQNYELKADNGRKGWNEHAPFDRILVAAASQDYPTHLINQLKVGGKMILPFGGTFSQHLVLIQKKETGIEKDKFLPVRFVPLIDN